MESRSHDSLPRTTCNWSSPLCKRGREKKRYKTPVRMALQVNITCKLVDWHYNKSAKSRNDRNHKKSVPDRQGILSLGQEKNPFSCSSWHELTIKSGVWITWEPARRRQQRLSDCSEKVGARKSENQTRYNFSWQHTRLVHTVQGSAGSRCM